MSAAAYRIEHSHCIGRCVVTGSHCPPAPAPSLLSRALIRVLSRRPQ